MTPLYRGWLLYSFPSTWRRRNPISAQSLFRLLLHSRSPSSTLLATTAHGRYIFDQNNNLASYDTLVLHVNWKVTRHCHCHKQIHFEVDDGRLGGVSPDHHHNHNHPRQNHPRLLPSGLCHQWKILESWDTRSRRPTEPHRRCCCLVMVNEQTDGLCWAKMMRWRSRIVSGGGGLGWYGTVWLIIMTELNKH